MPSLDVDLLEVIVMGMAEAAVAFVELDLDDEGDDEVALILDDNENTAELNGDGNS